VTPGITGHIPVLEASGLACGYGTTVVLHNVDLKTHRGEMVALLGRNGSGKSTLIRCLGGALSPFAGTVAVDGKAIAGYDRRVLARRLAVVAQELRVPFAFPVREVVELGRAPHARFLTPPSARDRRAVDMALDDCDLTLLSAHVFQHLSGGEQQRVALAMALAQEPEILLLDEPTVHLDLAHQVAFLTLIRRLCVERGVAVLAAMHDVNLTALFFDSVAVLGGGTVAALGTPGEVITAPLIETTFGTTVSISPHPRSGVPQVVLMP
jgi:iron complex transport system ATP-binding protein